MLAVILLGALGSRLAAASPNALIDPYVEDNQKEEHRDEDSKPDTKEEKSASPKGADNSEKGAKLVESATKHLALGALYMWHMPVDAISGASLIPQRQGDPIVRATTADRVRYVFIGDIPLLHGTRFQLGATVVLDPRPETFVLGGGLTLSAHVPNSPVWLGIGTGYAVVRYNVLPHGVAEGMPLPSAETMVELDHKITASMTTWLTLQLRF